MKKPTAATIARTVILVVALVNQALTMAGKSILPISDEQITEVISLAFTVVSALMAWWKNNSFTQAAITADETMKTLKSKK